MEYYLIPSMPLLLFERSWKQDEHTAEVLGCTIQQ